MMHATNSVFNLKRIGTAFYYSFCGLKNLLQNEVAFKQEVLLSFFVIPAACYFAPSLVTKAILISSWLLILIIEIINSAIEAVVDRISTEIHPLSKKIKDMSSAAVLLAIINAIIVWSIILSAKFV